MYWTLELASKLEDAPWPATKDELIDNNPRELKSGKTTKKIFIKDLLSLLFKKIRWQPSLSYLAL